MDRAAVGRGCSGSGLPLRRQRSWWAYRQLRWRSGTSGSVAASANCSAGARAGPSSRPGAPGAALSGRSGAEFSRPGSARPRR
jgi:hypothetical protein